MLKTLIVDDNSHLRLELCNTLYRFFPYLDLDEAVDGHEALRKATIRLPDVVFVGIGQDGLELTRQITNVNANTIVIVLIGDDLPEYRREAYLSGATGYINKSTCTAADIFAVIEGAMASRGPCKSKHLH